MTAFVRPEHALVCPEHAFMRPEHAFLRPEHAFVRPEHAFMRPEHAIVRPGPCIPAYAEHGFVLPEFLGGSPLGTHSGKMPRISAATNLSETSFTPRRSDAERP